MLHLGRGDRFFWRNMLNNTPAALLPSMSPVANVFPVLAGNSQVLCNVDPNRAGLIVSVGLDLASADSVQLHVYPVGFDASIYGLILNRSQNYVVMTFRDWGPFLYQSWQGRLEVDGPIIGADVRVLTYGFRPKQLGDL